MMGTEVVEKKMNEDRGKEFSFYGIVCWYQDNLAPILLSSATVGAVGGSSGIAAAGTTDVC